MEKKLPITLNLTIPPASMKKIVESGRLAEFVDTFSSLAKAHITSQVIEKLTTAQASGLSIAVGFDDEPGYGTVPHHWPWPHTGVFEDAMRQRAINTLAQQTIAAKGL